MEAKKVYEFIQKKSLRNTIKDDIGLKHSIDKKIQNFFKYLKNINDEVTYLITDKLNVIIYGNLDFVASDIEYFPDEIKEINGYVDLTDTKIKKLPDNLTIFGWLDLRYTDLDLPKGLEILNPRDNPSLLDLRHTKYDKYNMPILDLPDDLVVEKILR